MSKNAKDKAAKSHRNSRYADKSTAYRTYPYMGFMGFEPGQTAPGHNAPGIKPNVSSPKQEDTMDYLHPDTPGVGRSDVKVTSEALKFWQQRDLLDAEMATKFPDVAGLYQHMYDVYTEHYEANTGRWKDGADERFEKWYLKHSSELIDEMIDDNVRSSSPWYKRILWEIEEYFEGEVTEELMSQLGDLIFDAIFGEI